MYKYIFSKKSPTRELEDFLVDQISQIGIIDGNLPQNISSYLQQNPQTCMGIDLASKKASIGVFQTIKLNSKASQKTIRLVIEKCTRYYSMDGKFLNIGEVVNTDYHERLIAYNEGILN